MDMPSSFFFLVVGLAEAVEPDLGDRDAVDRGVELPVAGWVRLTRPAVLPDQTGIGAMPAWRANAASDLNRATPAVSPTSLAAVKIPHPRHAPTELERPARDRPPIDASPRR